MNANTDSHKQNLPPTVIRLGLVSFFADVSSEMLYPITPIFLSLVLGASAFNLGLIEGLAEGVASLLKTYSGAWSDRLKKRKAFVWFGYLVAALAKPLVGGASNWLQVLFARSMDRFGKGVRSAPRDALLAESVSPANLGAAFGWHRMMDTCGAALGPLLAILFLHFYSQPQQIRWLYYLAVIPGLLAVLLVFSIQENQKNTNAQPPVPKASIENVKFFSAFSSLGRAYKTYLVGWGFFSLANSSDIFLLLKMQKLLINQ